MKHIKHNHSNFQDILFKEASGLKILHQVINANHIEISVPTVHDVNEKKLVLDHINQSPPTHQQWQQFGYQLAKLHQLHQSSYGHTENNYIGLNPQPNTTNNDWGYFFYQQRLIFQINLIKSQPIKNDFRNKLDRVAPALVAFLNQNCSHSSVLHGDLWSGNVMFDQNNVWLIDPAVYCGDAEADLAMTELFGGFPNTFYNAYVELKPRSPAYSVKRLIYNFYHLLNHYNLFGSSYFNSCQQSLTGISNHFFDN